MISPKNLQYLACTSPLKDLLSLLSTNLEHSAVGVSCISYFRKDRGILALHWSGGGIDYGLLLIACKKWVCF